MATKEIVLQETDKDLIALVKEQIARDATNIELRYFISVCNRMQLDPFLKQIWAIRRYDSSLKKYVMGIQVAIDGYRAVAIRSGVYAGQLGPFWCGQDGVWKDVWLDDTKSPFAAKVGILRTDFKEPVWAIAKYSAMVAKTKEGEPNSFWKRMPDHMIAKCAEAQALRKAFAYETAGTTSDAEDTDNPIELISHTEQEKAKALKLSNPAQDLTINNKTRIQSLSANQTQNTPAQGPIEKPIVNHAVIEKKEEQQKVYTSEELERFPLKFNFGTFKSGLTLKQLGMNDVKSIVDSIHRWKLSKQSNNETIPPQLDEFLIVGKQYIERFKEWT